MKEILAENLQALFDNTSLSGKKTYSGEFYEVWEVSGEVYESMCNISDEEFDRLCPEGMWRSSTGSIFGYPTECFTVNKKKLKCWDRREELYGKKYRITKYESLLEYLCENIGASQPRNVCALAVDLAKYNGMTMGELFTKYGYPLISKEVSRDVAIARNKPDGKTAQKFIRGSDYHKKYGDTWLLERWAYLINAPFKISNQCCNIMKKTPAHKFNKESGMIPIIGTMACESVLRKKEWLRSGCNAFDNKNPSSKPLSFWTEQDILRYLKEFDIPYPSVYGEILQDSKGKYYTTGCDRTGCVFCGYGCHLKHDHRFERLKQTHPKLFEYCMKPVNEGGLGMKEVLEFIGVKIE